MYAPGRRSARVERILVPVQPSCTTVHEQLASVALAVADRAYVLESGRLVTEGPADEVADDPRVIEAYLGA